MFSFKFLFEKQRGDLIKGPGGLNARPHVKCCIYASGEAVLKDESSLFMDNKSHEKTSEDWNQRRLFICVFIREPVDVRLWVCELLTFCRGTKTHEEVKDYGINTLRACCEESEENVTILQHVMKPLPLDSSQYVLIIYFNLHIDLLFYENSQI